MTLHRKLKRQTDKRYTGYNYTCDGAYRPRVKGKDKKTKTTRYKKIFKRWYP